MEVWFCLPTHGVALPCSLLSTSHHTLDADGCAFESSKIYANYAAKVFTLQWKAAVVAARAILHHSGVARRELILPPTTLLRSKAMMTTVAPNVHVPIISWVSLKAGRDFQLSTCSNNSTPPSP